MDVMFIENDRSTLTMLIAFSTPSSPAFVSLRLTVLGSMPLMEMKDLKNGHLFMM